MTDTTDKPKPKTKSTTLMPTPVNFDLKSAITASVKCGQCLYFNRLTNKAYKAPCQTLGVFPKSDPCLRFSADPSLLPIKSDKKMRVFADLIQHFGKDSLQLLATVLNSATRTRAVGLHFGQVVYLRMFGDDYVSNYFRAYVVSARKDVGYAAKHEGRIEGTVVLSGSLAALSNVDDDNRSAKKKPWTGSVKLSSILTKDQWKKKLHELRMAGRNVDPKYKDHVTVKPKITIDYEPPTIDMSSDKLEKRNVIKRKGTGKVTTRSATIAH